MKDSEIRRIINHVFSTMSCPHCGERDLYHGETNIVMHSGSGLIFNVECPYCQTTIRVNGFLPGRLRYKKNITRQQNSYADIQRAVERIKKFRGNLADLFNE